MRIAVAATAPFGASVLEGLAEHHEIVLLISRPDSRRGRGRRLGPTATKERAEALGIPVVQPDRLTENPDAADVVVVAAYGLVIPDELLERQLWLNVHPSLLPRWRGAAPVERAIMAGDTETGVTVHRTTAELDAGPIAAQAAFAVAPGDNAGSVYDRAAPLAVELVNSVLPEPSFTPQDTVGVTYAEKILPGHRIVDCGRSAEEIVNQVRALSPHIGARAELDGRPILIWEARLAEPGALLEMGGVELLLVQPEGGRRMTAAQYTRGRR